METAEPTTVTTDRLEQALVEGEASIARIRASQIRLLSEIDARQVPLGDGCRNLSEWVAARLDLAPETARRLTQTAGHFADQPDLAVQLEEGAVSFDRATEEARLIDTGASPELVARSRGWDIAGIRRIVARHQRLSCQDETDIRRTVSVDTAIVGSVLLQNVGTIPRNRWTDSRTGPPGTSRRITDSTEWAAGSSFATKRGRSGIHRPGLPRRIPRRRRIRGPVGVHLFGRRTSRSNRRGSRRRSRLGTSDRSSHPGADPARRLRGNPQDIPKRATTVGRTDRQDHPSQTSPLHHPPRRRSLHRRRVSVPLPPPTPPHRTPQPGRLTRPIEPHHIVLVPPSRCRPPQRLSDRPPLTTATKAIPPTTTVARPDPTT